MYIRLAMMTLAATLAWAQPTPPQPQNAPPQPELKNVPTIWIVGDSTANNANHQGWGDPIANYFDLTKVNVVNRATAGRSSRTYTNEGRWDKVRDELKPGDFVLLQFGHNDGSAPGQPLFRGSLPGIGDESTVVTRDGKDETVYTYGWYNRKFINESKAKGAHPILLSPTIRNIWKDGMVERRFGDFSTWDAQIAKAENIPYVDLSTAMADQLQRMGEARVKPLFPIDHTHTNQEGADLNASLVISVLKEIPGQPFDAFLSEKGKAVTPHRMLLGMDRAGLNIPVPANPKLPTLFLIGDSTVRNGHGDGSNGQWGWGEPIVDLFDTAKINVVNRAVGGLSSRTYLTFGDWDRVVGMLKPGDFVVMQFGHNDSGAPDDHLRARASLPGSGDDIKEIENPLSMQHETVHTYGWYLKKFIADARAHGATPIVCSPIPRKAWKDGKVVRSSTTYQKWAAEVAESEHAPFIDLNEMIAAKYDAMGQEKVETMFADPNTHTTRAGAELNAKTVVEGLKAVKGNPLAGYFK